MFVCFYAREFAMRNLRVLTNQERNIWFLTTKEMDAWSTWCFTHILCEKHIRFLPCEENGHCDTIVRSQLSLTLTHLIVKIDFLFSIVWTTKMSNCECRVEKMFFSRFIDCNSHICRLIWNKWECTTWNHCLGDTWYC